MTFLSNGLSWFQKQRHIHTTKDVYLGYERTLAKPIKGTIASSDTNSTQDSLTQQTQSFIIICRTQDINIEKLNRGMKIWVATPDPEGRTPVENKYGQLYEMAYRGKTLYEYNDPDHNDINLYCVLKKDRCGYPFTC